MERKNNMQNLDSQLSELKQFCDSLGINDKDNSSLKKMLDDISLSVKKLRLFSDNSFKLILALLFLSVMFNFLQVDRTSALKSRIDFMESRDSLMKSRDSLLSKILGADSLSFVTYKIKNGVPVSYKQLLSENDSLLKKYYSTKNDGNRYKEQIELVLQNYPLSIKEEGNIMYVYAPKIDSALMLLPIYRDRISYNEKERAWLIVRPK